MIEFLLDLLFQKGFTPQRRPEGAKNKLKLLYGVPLMLNSRWTIQLESARLTFCYG